MESSTDKQINSGTTTPGTKHAQTMSTDWYYKCRVRDDDEQTMVTSVTGDSGSAQSAHVPHVPLNSPEQSYAPSLDSDFDKKVRELAKKFNDSSLPDTASQPTSVSNEEKGTARRAHLRSKSRDYYPGPRQSSKRRFAPSRSVGESLIRKLAGEAHERHVKAASIDIGLLKLANSTESFGKNNVRDPKQGVMEYSQWASYAEEDVTHSLQRLARLARDLHQKNNSKTVEQYYSEYLTKLIKAAELKFDPRALL